MGQPNFVQPPTPPMAESVHHGLSVELGLELGDPLRCRKRVPLS